MYDYNKYYNERTIMVKHYKKIYSDKSKIPELLAHHELVYKNLKELLDKKKKKKSTAADSLAIDNLDVLFGALYIICQDYGIQLKICFV